MKYLSMGKPDLPLIQYNHKGGCLDEIIQGGSIIIDPKEVVYNRKLAMQILGAIDSHDGSNGTGDVKGWEKQNIIIEDFGQHPDPRSGGPVSCVGGDNLLPENAQFSGQPENCITGVGSLDSGDDDLLDMFDSTLGGVGTNILPPVSPTEWANEARILRDTVIDMFHKYFEVCFMCALHKVNPEFINKLFFERYGKPFFMPTYDHFSFQYKHKRSVVFSPQRGIVNIFGVGINKLGIDNEVHDIQDGAVLLAMNGMECVYNIDAGKIRMNIHPKLEKWLKGFEFSFLLGLLKESGILDDCQLSDEDFLLGLKKVWYQENPLSKTAWNAWRYHNLSLLFHNTIAFVANEFTQAAKDEVNNLALSVCGEILLSYRKFLQSSLTD